jgi:hypothetical protein
MLIMSWKKRIGLGGFEKVELELKLDKELLEVEDELDENDEACCSLLDETLELFNSPAPPAPLFTLFTLFVLLGLSTLGFKRIFLTICEGLKDLGAIISQVLTLIKLNKRKIVITTIIVLVLNRVKSVIIKLNLDRVRNLFL